MLFWSSNFINKKGNIYIINKYIQYFKKKKKKKKRNSQYPQDKQLHLIKC